MTARKRIVSGPTVHRATLLRLLVVWRIIEQCRSASHSLRDGRIGKARALHVINSTEPTVVPADEETREKLVWVGWDDRRLDLEVVAIVEPDYLLVIHVMPYQFRRRTP